MSSNQELIFGLPRRPHIADASPTTIMLAIAGGLIAGPVGVVVGAVAGNAVANQRQPLEMAIREYFAKQPLELIFYYPAPRAAKVTFQYGPNAYWTVETNLPEGLELSPEDTADWLYGNLIAVKLPKVLRRLKLAG